MFNFFEIIRNKSVFVKLHLPQSMKIHNVFYLNLFQKVSLNPLTNQINKLTTLVIINSKKKWKIKDILDTRSY